MSQPEKLVAPAVDERSAELPASAATDLFASPRLDFSLNRLFYRSPAQRAPLRVGVLMNGPEAPLFMRKVLEDVRACDFAELVCVVENAATRGSTRPRLSSTTRLARSLLDGERRRQVLYMQYMRRLDRKYRKQPDPMALVDCSDLLEGAARVCVTPISTKFVDRFPAEAVEQIKAFDLDVVLRFGFRIIRGDILNVARHGVWSFHHGDSERYRGGPPLMWELIEGSPLSGAVLQRLEESLDAGPVLCSANLSTSARPSVSANRFNVYWTTEHFVIQKLYELHRFGPEHLEQRTVRHKEYLGRRKVYRTPTNFDMARWLAPTLLRKFAERRRTAEDQMHWRIGLRRASTPLYRDPANAANEQFIWLDSPRGRFWADPFLIEHQGATWLFFEDYDYASKRGAVACGRIEAGRLVDVRTVLKPPFHLSYPHVFAHDGAVWMAPESLEAGAVQLYRATRFPDEWKLERTLIEVRAVDPTLFRHGGRWWMFVSPMTVNAHAPITLLFSAPDLFGPWTLHRNSPICTDVRWARAAGAIIQDGERLLRPSQDCSRGYGHSICFNEITSLGGERYEETRAACFTPETLSLPGVHTYNRAGEWETIDGRSLMPRKQVLNA